MEPHRTEQEYWLALARAPQLNGQKLQHMLHSGLTLAELFCHPASALVPWKLHPETIAYLKQPPWLQIERDYTILSQLKAHSIPIVSEHYPDLLTQIANPPIVLFAQGQLEYLQKPKIAMVGSRNPSYIGQENAIALAYQLAETGLTVVSGLALGIDAICHQGALRGQGKTIAVLGTSLDKIYPQRHQVLAEEIRHNGLLLSEFLPNTAPLASNFPRRNRIISGLSYGVVVVEAALRSGSLITARYATEDNREVFAIPGSIHHPLSAGCHYLIQQGAKLTTCVQDILDELSFHSSLKNLPKLAKTTTSLPKLDQKQQKILNCIDTTTTSTDQITERSGLSIENVMVMLSNLVLAGYIITVPGGYALKNT
jgi:DNA processing protein